MGLEIVACHALVTPGYEFMDHNLMGRYRILVVFKRRYYIYLKDDFVIKRLNPVCKGLSKSFDCYACNIINDTRVWDYV